MGCARGNISYCYAGGSIVSNMAGTAASTDDGLCVWTGGIMGGNFMLKGGNLDNLTGPVNNPVDVSSCYSYVDLPQGGGANHVAFSATIASNGEGQTSGQINTIQGGVVKIYNSFAYKDLAEGSYNFDNFSTKPDEFWVDDGVDIGNPNRSKKLNHAVYMYNYEKHPYLTYTEMTSGATPAADLINKLGGVASTPWRAVTIYENPADDSLHGSHIPGKYSFPADNTTLKGYDYPFPTVIVQEDSFGDTVHLHHGYWPLFDGLFLDKLGVRVDLISKDGLGQGEHETVVEMKFYSNGLLADMNSAPEWTSSSPGVAEVSALTPIYVMSDGTEKRVYRATIRGKSAGYSQIEFSYGGSAATVQVSVSATVKLSAEEMEPDLQVPLLGTKIWKLRAFDRHNNEINNLRALNWKAVSKNTNIVPAEGLKINEYMDEVYLSATGYQVGSCLINVSALNVPTHVGTFVPGGSTTVELTVISPPADVTVKFYLDKGKTQLKETRVLPYGTVMDSPPLSYTDPNGRVLDYWMTINGALFDLAKPVMGDANLYAKWEYNTVSLVNDGVQTAKLYAAGGNYYAEDSLETTVTSLTPPSKTGYTFNGYYDTLSSPPAAFTDASGSIVMSASGITTSRVFHASWTKIPEYIVTLSSSKASNVQTASFSALVGSDTLPAYTVPTRALWDFKGWYASTPSGYKMVIEYKEGSSTIVHGVSGYTSNEGKWIMGTNITLYAGWQDLAFVRANTLAIGENYIITFGDSGTVRFVLGSPNPVKTGMVEVQQGVDIYDSSGAPITGYIRSPGDDAVWTFTSGDYLRNKGRSEYLHRGTSWNPVPFVDFRYYLRPRDTYAFALKWGYQGGRLVATNVAITSNYYMTVYPYNGIYYPFVTNLSDNTFALLYREQEVFSYD